MALRTLAAAVGAALVITPALAQNPATEGNDQLFCFQRAYSAEHMAEHPGQRVSEMLVVFDSFTIDGRNEAGATIRAMMRDRFGEFFANSGYCQDEGGGHYRCGIDCDGGQFGIDLNADGTLLLRNEQYGFVLYGGCGDEAEEDQAVFIEADAEHRAFLLYPIPVEACPSDLWQSYDAGQ